MRVALLLGGLAVLACISAPAAAQQSDPPNGVLLVAKPGLADPRFRDSVVLVTQTADAQTVGVILNKPTQTPPAEYLPPALAKNYTDRIFFGGPVLERALVALFRAAEPPGSPSFPVLKGVYLSMHPGAIEPLLTESSAARGRFRLYAGFSGWLPGQLENEIRQDNWYVVPVTEELLFRADTASMWRELVDKARGSRARVPSIINVKFHQLQRAPATLLPG